MRQQLLTGCLTLTALWVMTTARAEVPPKITQDFYFSTGPGISADGGSITSSMGYMLTKPQCVEGDTSLFQSILETVADDVYASVINQIADYESDFSIVWNPAKNTLEVVTASGEGLPLGILHVYNSLGEAVGSSHSDGASRMFIDMSRCGAGIYIAGFVCNGNIIASAKFQKQ